MFEFAAVYSMEKLVMVAALTVAVMAMAALAAYTWCSGLAGRRKGLLLLLQAVALVTLAGHFLVLVSPPGEMFFFAVIHTAGACLLGPALFFYVAEGFGGNWRRVAAMLSVVPAAGAVMALASGGHGLVFTVHETLTVSYGSAFFCIVGYNCVIGVAAVVLLYRTGAWRVLLRGFRPVLAARMDVLDSLNESVVMGDGDGHVVYFNGTELVRGLGLSTGDGVERLEELTGGGECGEVVREGRCYAWHRSGLQWGGQKAGVLYTFRDITVYRELIDRLNRKNEELGTALARLREYAETSGKLAEETERNRIVLRVQETVGGYLGDIIRNLEEACGLDGPELEDKITLCVSLARTGIGKIRESLL